MATETNPEIEAALRRLLVDLERTDDLEYWQRPVQRSNVETEPAELSENCPQAA